MDKKFDKSRLERLLGHVGITMEDILPGAFQGKAHKEWIQDVALNIKLEPECTEITVTGTYMTEEKDMLAEAMGVEHYETSPMSFEYTKPLGQQTH